MMGGITKYGRDKPIPMTVGLDPAFDLADDFFWVMRRAIPQEQLGEGRRILCLAATDFAARVLSIYEKQYPTDDRPRQVIKVTRAFAQGKARRKELDAARAAAGAAGAAAGAVWAAWAAAGAAGAAGAAAGAAGAAAGAAWAAWAAAWAAGAAAGAAEDTWQRNRLREYLEHPDTKPLPLPRKSRRKAA